MKLLVTGASRGLGLELTTAALKHGHQVLATWLGAPEDPSALEALAKEYPGKLDIEIMDVTKEDQVSAVAERTKSLDWIVNSAGVLMESKYNHQDPIVNLDVARYRKTLDVNSVGPAIVLKHFAGLVYQSADPCIINVTSEAGHLCPGGYEYMMYSISKHAANMLTQQYRNYLVSNESTKNVRIFMLHPGRMNTVMGAENAQIEPNESAEGIMRILEGKINPQMEIPFINYKGEPMPY